MSEYTPKRLNKSQIRKEFDDYLDQLERNELHSHMREIITAHTPEGETDYDGARTLADRMAKERDRLVSLAKGKDKS